MADNKITGLAALTAPVNADLLVIVDDIAGTPITKKITLEDLLKTIDLTGGQIAFPASAVPSADPNTIDDYEEGSFDVTLTCGTSGTITVDTSYNSLAYTKTGRLVCITGGIRMSAISSPVGTVAMSLPFTALGLAEDQGQAYSLISHLSLGALTAGSRLVLSTKDELILELTNSTISNSTANYIGATTRLYFNHSYLAT